MRIAATRRPAPQCLPVEVLVDDAEDHTDLEVRNLALVAVGETADRFTAIRVQRYAGSTDVIVKLFRD